MLNNAKRTKLCPCNCLINTAFSDVQLTYGNYSAYQFGSVYFTSHNTMTIKRWATTPLFLNPKAVHILQDIMVSSSFWYKTQMVDKIRLIQELNEE